MRQVRRYLISLITAVVLIGVLVVGGQLYTSALWYDSLGYLSVLWTRVGTEVVLFTLGWAVSAGVLVGNWFLARRLAGGTELRLPWFERALGRRRGTGQPTTRALGARAAKLLLAGAGLGIGFLFAQRFRHTWPIVLQALRAVPFGQQDPLLGRDIGFYVFSLPFLQLIQGWLLGLAIVALIGTLVVYLASQSIQVAMRRALTRLPTRGIQHLTLLGAVGLALISWGYWLDVPGLLYSTRGAAFGAGYADVHARLPVYYVLMGITGLGALLLPVNLLVPQRTGPYAFWRFRRFLPYILVGTWLVVSLLGGSVWPGIMQRLTVEPNELARELPYIEHSIALTRQAYGLDKIVERDFPVSEEAGVLDLAANRDTIQNIRLWDYRPLLRTYGQLQEIRLYYSFADADIDRYTIGDDYRQVILAARELDTNELPDTARTWVNRHLVYTHGHGVVLSPVNEVGQEGLPRLWVRDLPSVSTDEVLRLTRPEIYYGERTTDYVLVRTTQPELDYPSGDQNVYTTYAGEGGVRLNSAFKRLAFAWRLGAAQVVLSRYVQPDTHVLWRRTIAERVEELAPFLIYDPDPYPVIVEGRLVWMLDAYTTSRQFPYAQPVDLSGRPLNYIRNSVKVTIDAYDGDVTFYVIDEDDPVVQMWRRAFPTLFHAVDDMHPVLRAHWRYPEQLFRIQALQYQRYHMTDPQVFYNQEDLWNWAREIVGGAEEWIEPYYVIMRRPGEAQAEFLLMLPFTPSTKQNMVAWLYARCDDPAYGELGVFKFPKQRLIYGPMQVESRIDQDPLISQQLSLWNQRGSQVIRGNLLVIPLGESILYVEPLYLQAEASQLPELRRVIVAYGNSIAMEATLSEALAQVLAGDVVAEVPSVGAIGDDVGTLAREAEDRFLAAQECLRTSDWACYGAEMEALETILQALVEVTEGQP
jgi:uncharacterized membrane protein (UPF0182 family)